MTTVEAALARLESVDTEGVLLDLDRDLLDRSAKSGTLAGEAIVVKNCIAIPGYPTTGASPVLADHQVPVGRAIDRLLAEGVVILGPASMHEIAFGVSGRNDWQGMPTNPAAPDRLPGGSSSGSAVAVALGIVDVALGTDTGGSSRIPAACCGITGFRPSTGRYPSDGLLVLSQTRDTIGVLARRLEDIVRFDRVLAAAPAPTDGTATVELPRRLAVLDSDGLDRCDDQVRHAYRNWLDRCTSAGIELVEIDLDPILDLNEQASFAVALRETIESFRAVADQQGLTYDAFVAGLAGDDVRALMSLPLPTAEDRQRALTEIIPAMQAWYDEILDQADLLVIPTMPVVPPLRSEHDEITTEAGPTPTFPTMAAFTSAASLAGVPSLSVPIEAAGPPVAVMAEGRRGQDERLLQQMLRLVEVTQ